ncbi:LOW QUALITY PROTEIN: hypothetical protein MXB_1163, partial [Myxobolus squamalis]
MYVENILKMKRFVEYFAIIGINEEIITCTSVNEQLFPKILHITPQIEWEYFSFPSGLPEFCFPDGCSSVAKYCAPIFFANVLTSIDGSRYYCAILLFYERADTIKKLYIPKAFTIVSKYAYISNYYDCLDAIFKSLRCDKEKMDTCIAENLICQIIYNNSSPEPGSEKFIIPLIDNQSIINPPIFCTIPATEDNVATLLELVGIKNLVKLYGALLLDNRIAFISKSYNYLYKCSNALISLAYPINYKYVYIPILPKSLIDYVGAPTPFIVGFHSSSQFDTSDLIDVLFVDLDTGRIKNENLCSPYIPEPYFTQIHRFLTEYTNPNFFSKRKVNLKKTELKRRILDKLIRACILYLFLKLISSYQQSTTYARLIPSPVLRFDEEVFMSRRTANSQNFYSKLFKTTSFSIFIAERANNYRACDYFDDLIEEFPNYKDDVSIKKLIERISDHFINNESMHDLNQSINSTEYLNRKNFKNLKICHPDSYKMLMPIYFNPVPATPSERKMCNVPFNTDSFQNEMSFTISKSHNDAIENFISSLFKGEISENSLIIDCINTFISSKACIFSFINEILKMKTIEKAMLSSEQMVTISSLFNAILTEDKNRALYCSAAQILKIACNFFHSLNEKNEFLYTYIRHHEIWRDHIFWENYFFIEIQSSLLNLYRIRYSDYVSPALTISPIIKADFPTVIHPELVTALDIRNICVLLLSEYPSFTDTERINAEFAEINAIYICTARIIVQISYMPDVLNQHYEKENINNLEFKPSK